MRQLLTVGCILAVAVSLWISGCGSTSPKTVIPEKIAPPAKLELGYFANITHAQALIGLARGDFQKALGATRVEPHVFNAGPSVVEAFFAGGLDLAYVGPAPSVNAFAKSNGQKVRIISGACANGVVVVARKDSGIAALKDLKGHRIATPQYGNTQDVCARHYLTDELGLKLKSDGGDTEILCVKNAEQLALFKKGDLDAAWVPEPWGARLVNEADGVIVAEEKTLWPDQQFCTAVVLVSTEFLKQHPQTVEAFLKAHVALTEWIKQNPEEAAKLADQEISKVIGKPLPPEVLKQAFGRLMFTTDPLPQSVQSMTAWSAKLGLLETVPDLKPLFDLTLLEKAKAAAAGGR